MVPNSKSAVLLSAPRRCLLTCTQFSKHSDTSHFSRFLKFFCLRKIMIESLEIYIHFNFFSWIFGTLSSLWNADFRLRDLIGRWNGFGTEYTARAASGRNGSNEWRDKTPSSGGRGRQKTRAKRWRHGYRCSDRVNIFNLGYKNCDSSRRWEKIDICGVLEVPTWVNNDCQNIASIKLIWINFRNNFSQGNFSQTRSYLQF